MSIVEEIIQRQKSMESSRGNWNNTWQEISDYMLPRSADFITKQTPGTKRRSAILDNEGEQALGRFATGLHNALTGEGQPWFFLKAEPRVARRRDVKVWLEEVSRRMFRMFNSPVSNFHPAAHEFYTELGAFGTAVMFIEDRPGIGPHYQSFPLYQCYIDQDDGGTVDTLFRQFPFTAKQVQQKWGVQALTPRMTADLGDKKNTSFDIIHAVWPRGAGVVADSMAAKDKPWGSAYVAAQEKQLLTPESGFDEFPYVVSRWTRNAGEKYGRGRGHVARPDVKMLNKMESTLLQGLELLVNPPYDLVEGSYLHRPRVYPGALNHRRAGFRGEERMQPLIQNQAVDLGEGKTEQIRDRIRKIFFNDLFLAPGPLAPDGDVQHQSATEFSIRERQRLAQLGPIFSRQKVEYLGPSIGRTFNIMDTNRQLPPPPDDLRAGDLDIGYLSPLAIAQEAGEVAAIQETILAVQPIAALDPSVMDRLNLDEGVAIIAEGLRAPARMIRSDDEIEQIRERQGQQAEEERQAALASQDASAAKDLSQALTIGRA